MTPESRKYSLEEQIIRKKGQCMLVHSLKTIHEKYKDSLANLQDVTSVIKEYQKEQMTETKQCN